MSQSLPSHLRHFLGLYNGRMSGEALSARDWDTAIRIGWSAGMLGSFAERMRANKVTVPPEAERHFEAIQSTVRFRHRMAHLELDRVAEVLAPLDVPIIVAKGAAYMLQDLPCGRWRLFADVDIIVPRDRIGEVEQILHAHGWQSETLDPYDQHYYRAWSHELPPMRYASHPLELDVHHTILPLTGRIQPDAEGLFDASRRIEGTPFLVLCPEDQVLHACAHLFQDSDLSDRMRELADIDGLLRAFGSASGFWNRLEARAELHEMQRPLWYALRYARAYFDTPVPSEFFDTQAPSYLIVTTMDALTRAALPPCNPDRKPNPMVRSARLMLYIRSLWLRMPPWLLLRHLLKKGLRRVGEKEQAEPVAP
ncbi:MAG TPA: nucleotidyltransferase family protein [Burkholderiales bacterium]|nr:nucleotidyltransferase family protein [Burkholderiales bacterium]